MKQIELNDGNDYISFTPKKGSSNVEIIDIVVNTQQRVGTGTRLVRTLENTLQDVKHCVLFAYLDPSNNKAASFLTAVGFKSLILFCDFFGEGKNAVIYTKVLS